MTSTPPDEDKYGFDGPKLRVTCGKQFTTGPGPRITDTDIKEYDFICIRDPNYDYLDGKTPALVPPPPSPAPASPSPAPAPVPPLAEPSSSSESSPSSKQGRDATSNYPITPPDIQDPLGPRSPSRPSFEDSIPDIPSRDVSASTDPPSAKASAPSQYQDTQSIPQDPPKRAECTAVLNRLVCAGVRFDVYKGKATFGDGCAPRSVIIKILDPNVDYGRRMHEIVDSVIDEAEIYGRLHDLQGGVVPGFLGLWAGQRPLPDRPGYWVQLLLMILEDVGQAIAWDLTVDLGRDNLRLVLPAVRALHDFGVVHRYLEPHLVIPRTGRNVSQPGICLVGFRCAMTEEHSGYERAREGEECKALGWDQMAHDRFTPDGVEIVL